MVVAELKEYPSTHELLCVLEKAFKDLEWGDQGMRDMPDAYFWVRDGKLKVAIDNLDSYNFQVKCPKPDAQLVKNVIDVLSKAFSMHILERPVPEPHE